MDRLFKFLLRNNNRDWIIEVLQYDDDMVFGELHAMIRLCVYSIEIDGSMQ